MVIIDIFKKYIKVILAVIVIIVGVVLGVYFGKIKPDQDKANNTNNIKNTDDLYICGPNVNKKCTPPFNYCNHYKNKNIYRCENNPLNSSDIINISEYNAITTPASSLPSSLLPTNNTDECGPYTVNKKCGPTANYCTNHKAIKNYYCTQFLKNNDYETNIPEYNFVENNTSKECYKNKNCNDITHPFCNLNKCSSVSNLSDIDEYKNYNKNDITYCGNTTPLSLCNNNNYCVAIDKSKPVGYCTNDIKTVDNSTIICITGNDCPGNLVCDKTKNGFSTCVQEINKNCTDTTECMDDIIGKEKLKNNFNNINPYKCCTDFYSDFNSYKNITELIGIKNRTGYCERLSCKQEKKCLDPNYIPGDIPCAPEKYKTFNAELTKKYLDDNYELKDDPKFIGDKEKQIYYTK